MDAMEKLGSLETDLIIVDLNMPNMDGISFVKNLRNSYYNLDLPVVMLTTTSDGELKEEALEAGVNMFLNKPIQPEVLVHKIESLLDGRSLMSDDVSEKDEMKEIIDEFIVEAYDLAEKATQDIITIENNPDEEAINSIFRAVHTIKGTSSFLGFGTLSTLAHRSEDIFGMVRKGNLKPDHAVADVLLESLDLIKTLLDDIKENGSEVADTAACIVRLEALAQPESAPT